jgi:structure-specific recognition protein 1/high mobility group protein B2/high mobility group protein B3
MSSDDEDIDSIDEEEEEVVVVKKSRKKKKKNQDPNRPKRNMSAFFLYSNAHRERIKQEQPDAKFGDIVSSIFEIDVLLVMMCMIC